MWEQIKTKIKSIIDGMLCATFISTLFYSATYPKIFYMVMQNAPDNLLAIVNIINCLGIVLAGWLWNHYSNKLFIFYPLYLGAETLGGIFTTTFAIMTQRLVAFYLLDTMVVAIISRNIVCGGNKLRALRYLEDAREKFDNNRNSLEAIATILGSAIALVLPLSFNKMLIIATIGNAIDNIFYLVIFHHTTNNQS